MDTICPNCGQPCERMDMVPFRVGKSQQWLCKKCADGGRHKADTRIYGRSAMLKDKRLKEKRK